jgi:flagellar motility protein MotE (MotC chaperone)
MPFPHSRAALVAFCLALPGLAAAQDRGPEQDTANGVAPLKPVASATAGSTVAPAAAPPAPVAQPLPPVTEAQRYCDNIAAVAAEARFAWQTRKLTELQTQVAARVAELEKKQAALEASLAKRDDIMKRTEATLIAVYAKMAPDAAAAQLSLLEDNTAAAVLTQLSPRQASAILDEIKPERASQLVGAMTNLPAPDKGDGKDGKKS